VSNLEKQQAVIKDSQKLIESLQQIAARKNSFVNAGTRSILSPSAVASAQNHLRADFKFDPTELFKRNRQFSMNSKQRVKEQKRSEENMRLYTRIQTVKSDYTQQKSQLQNTSQLVSPRQPRGMHRRSLS